MPPKHSCCYWSSPARRRSSSSSDRSASSMVDPERIVVPLISKWLLVWVSVVLIVNLTERKSFGSASADFHVVPGTGRIHDGLGRERIFHGLNVVVKGAPWHPQVNAFDARNSFTDADIALLKAWGMNVVRLGIMWPGVEPGRGYVNSTYLAVMQSIVGKLHSAGIFTVLEFHQDLYASQFCGEGLPSWILDDYDLSPSFVQDEVQTHHRPRDHARVDHPNGKVNHKGFSEYSRRAAPSSPSSLSLSFRLLFQGQPRAASRSQGSDDDVMLSAKMRYPASFPEPLGRRWPWPSEWEKEGWEPPVELCNKHSWWLFYLSYAVSRAFQDLYDNKWGWGDLLARYWTVVAEAFKDQPGVLGYELMNEPWPGDVFSNPLLFLPGVADKINLASFYEKLQAAVRSVDKKRILFFESITFDNFRCGLSTVPGGVQWQNKTVLSYHYYTPPNFSAKQALAERSRESKRLGCGSMLTEFFVSTEHDRQDQVDFRKAWRSVLRNTIAKQILDDKLRADDAASLCDSHGERSTDVFCGKEWRRLSDNDLSILSELPVVDKEGVIEAEKGRPVVRGRGAIESEMRLPAVKWEGVIGADKVSNWSLNEFNSLITLDVKTSLRNAHTQSDHHQQFGSVDAGDDMILETAVKPTFEMQTPLQTNSRERQTSVEKEVRMQRRARDVDSVDEVLSAADFHVQSWIGWEYKAFFQKTGSIAKQSLFNEDGEVDAVLAKKLGRTYPQRVCGNIISFAFDPPSSVFTFSYTAGCKCMLRRRPALTEIFVQREFYYPNGLAVEVSPPCASFTETNMGVQIRHTGGCFGYVINVRISRIDPLS